MMKKTEIQWENFSINSPDFIKAERGSSLSSLLHNYFSKNSITSLKFISDLSENYPELLLNSIRVNRAFLNPEHFKSFEILKLHTNKYLSDHYFFFSKLAQIENELYAQFEKSLDLCISTEILKDLIWVSFWFEEKRANLFKTQSAHILVYDIHPFIETIDFFLTHYLFKNKEGIKNSLFENEQDIEMLLKAYLEAKSLQDFSTQKIWKTLDKAHEYLGFLKSTIEIYSYDLNYDIEINDNIVTLKYKDVNKLKRWLIENEKLNYWYNYYRLLATELVNSEMEINPKFIKNKNGIDYLMNLEGAIRSGISQSIAEDFCLKDSKLFDVPVNSLITVLNGFVVNAWGRFVEPMDKLNYLNPTKWLDNMMSNSIKHGQITLETDGKQLSAFPSRFIDKETIKGIIKDNVSNSESYSESLLSFMSIEINSIQYINRLKPFVNISAKPFIKLNDFYYAFNGMLGETNSQTNILVNIMESNRIAHSRVMKGEIELMEEKVRQMFLDKGFTNSDFSLKYFIEEMFFGDFDIIVYENGVLLLIELKRSKMRIHLSEAHDEYENNLLKASNQLEKAYDYIKNNFTKCKADYFQKLNIKETEFSQLKIYPIIVSTSFEQDHTAINDKHFKISLFELQNIIERDIDPISGNKLEGLILKLLRNEYWVPLEREFVLPELEKYILRMPL